VIPLLERTADDRPWQARRPNTATGARLWGEEVELAHGPRSEGHRCGGTEPFDSRRAHCASRSIPSMISERRTAPNARRPAATSA